MKLAVVADGHYTRTPDGKVWAESIYDYKFFSRYIEIFDEVVVVTRVKKQDEVKKDKLLSSGENIYFYDLPNFQKGRGLMKVIFKVYSDMNSIFKNCDAVLIRTPSILSIFAVSAVKRVKVPFALEVVADPSECYIGPHEKSIIDYVIRFIMKRHLKRTCQKANGVAYVTKKSLQQRYPCKGIVIESERYFTSNYSSVVLSDDYIYKPKKFDRNKRFIIVHAASDINGISKGHKVLIDIVKKITFQKYDVMVKFIGSGVDVEKFSRYANKLGIGDKVNFIGAVQSREKFREELIDSDLCVFPSMSEGLPRFLIEAMACGLPCVSSNVGGIPELLKKEDLFNPLDTDGFTNRVIKYIDDHELYENKSIESIEIAKVYTESCLRPTRNSFYSKLRGLAEISRNNVS